MDSYRDKDAYREDKSSVKESVCKLRDNAAIETKGKIEKTVWRVQQQLAFSEHILTAAGKRPQPFWCAGGGYGDGGSVFNRC